MTSQLTAKEQYKALCQTEGSRIPLFQQYWWMETVCVGKRWDVLLVHDADGNIVAALPFLDGRKLFLRYVLQPQLTQYSGPWFRTDNVEEQYRVAANLIRQLRSLRLCYFQQNFSPIITNWLPFHWQHFHQTTRYTYRLDDISDPQRVFENFDPSRRQRQIRRLEGKMQPVEISSQQFVQFHTNYWSRRGRKDLLSQDFMLNVIQTAIDRGQGLLIAVADDRGIQGARFVVYDDRCAYSLLSALADNHPNGTSAFLFYEIIKCLSSRTRAFDFEGSMDPGIEQSYRLYGATQTPYFRITKIL